MSTFLYAAAHTFLYWNLLGLFAMLWTFFLLAAIQDWFEDTPVWKVIKYPWGGCAAIFLIVDVIYDKFPVSLFFWDKYEHWRETVTERMKRYKAGNYGWRTRFAIEFCRMLSTVAKGHC